MCSGQPAEPRQMLLWPCNRRIQESLDGPRRTAEGLEPARTPVTIRKNLAAQPKQSLTGIIASAEEMSRDFRRYPQPAVEPERARPKAGNHAKRTAVPCVGPSLVMGVGLNALPDVGGEALGLGAGLHEDVVLDFEQPDEVEGAALSPPRPIMVPEPREDPEH